MSMFICQRCDELRDSDDGCIEGKSNGLICADCMADLEDDEEAYHTYSSPAEAGAAVRRKQTHTQSDIYETLIKAGCPDDIARELAREKGK
jgi:hypothetical protein